MTTERFGAAPGQDGVSMTVKFPTGEPPSMQDVPPRLKNNRPVWIDLNGALINDPDSFANNRYVNDRMPVKGAKGRKPDGSGFGGGYAGRLKTRAAAKRVSITSSRPYSPGYTSEFIDQLSDALTAWWLDGAL